MQSRLGNSAQLKASLTAMPTLASAASRSQFVEQSAQAPRQLHIAHGHALPRQLPGDPSRLQPAAAGHEIPAGAAGGSPQDQRTSCKSIPGWFRLLLLVPDTARTPQSACAVQSGACGPRTVNLHHDRAQIGHRGYQAVWPVALGPCVPSSWLVRSISAQIALRALRVQRNVHALHRAGECARVFQLEGDSQPVCRFPIAATLVLREGGSS